MRRTMKRVALILGGVFMMAAFFYWLVWGFRLDAAVMATMSAALVGYGMA